MTLTITDTTITSDQTPHTARHAPGNRHWDVSWLPGQPLDRNTAITAMLLADTAQAGPDEGHRLWPFIQSWAGELALTAPDAITRASGPPEKTSSQELHRGVPGPEHSPPLPDGQPVSKGGGGRLVPSCEPHAGDGTAVTISEPEAGRS